MSRRHGNFVALIINRVATGNIDAARKFCRAQSSQIILGVNSLSSRSSLVTPASEAVQAIDRISYIGNIDAARNRVSHQSSDATYYRTPSNHRTKIRQWDL